MPESLQPLVGRELELALLSTTLDGVGANGAAILIRGAVGVGKSSLLDAARRQALIRGMPTLSVSGYQGELNLAFAGLHQLVQPMLGRAKKVPQGQREALLTAFGMSRGGAADAFLIALGALELLTSAAEDAGLLVCVSDAQWLDGPTVSALSFVARRCASTRIVMLIEARDGYSSELFELGLQELDVQPLEDDAARALLSRHASGLSQEQQDAVLRLAGGNPLALVELPIALSAADGAFAAVDEKMPLTARLERAFGDRLSDLPAPVRSLMIVAAQSDGDLLKDVIAAAQVLDATVDADTPRTAVRAALIDIDQAHIRMRHPLVRSAIRAAVSTRERIRAHEALAQVLVHSPDSQAWHLAIAATGPDEHLAAALELVAEGAVDRGGVSAAVETLERSAELTPDTDDRGRRFVAAAQLAAEVGNRNVALRLVDFAGRSSLSVVDRAKLDLVREVLDPGRPGDSESVINLVHLAKSMADVDPDLALGALYVAASKSWWADPGAAARAAVAAAADSLPIQDDPRLLSILAFVDPEGRGTLIVERARGLLAHRLAARDAHAVGVALNLIGDFDLSASFLDAAVTGLRSEGRLALLPEVLAHQAWTAINAGNWPVAVSAAEEGTRLGRLTNQVLWEAASTAGRAMIAGLRGDHASALSLADEAERLALPTRAAAALAGIQLTRGATALATGDYQSAYEQLRRTFDPSDPSYHHFQKAWNIGDFVEAAVRSGRREEALLRVAELEPLARDSRSSWLVAGLIFARPILAEDHDAEDAFQLALQADLSDWPLYRGRLLYQYGVWLRRQRRILDARPPLREARDWFDAHGLFVWSERARHELRASGESSRRPQHEAWTSLSPQELQVALMAADGLSNADIARRLFLSRRTVASHLYRVFPKLDVTSRTQLRAALEVREPAVDAGSELRT